MSAETLRRAAALMRERAEAATPGPWAVTSTTAGLTGILSTSDIAPTVYSTHVGAMRSDDMRHIASWHPAVALAVADWLDALAKVLDEGDYTVESDVLPTWLHCHLDNIAATYLGESA